ncbi:zinc-binding alcohol dehydrogenase family protein [Erwinia sp. CPCC 100877]|nr:zinc-binding alcohol dehydrogenase family protein [Erwinia sp. CPCC 100877]
MSIEKQMKAVGFYEGLPIDNEKSFVDAWQPIPEPKARELLVKVKAVSVNPVDTKLRQTTKKQAALRVLGFDGVGEVVALGNEVENFKLGDRVFYAGTTTKAGSNQEIHLVDERIAALAPANLTDAQAAALPLTALTAYELLFEKFGLVPKENANAGKTILIINGAGGVGSILSQLAHWAGLEIFATSSPKNFHWLQKNSVDYPVDYHQEIKPQIENKNVQYLDYIAVLFDIHSYLELSAELIKPFGHVGTIVETEKALDMNGLKNKAVSFDWEYMFAKTDYNYRVATQGEILQKIAELVELGKLKSTLNTHYTDGINAKNLKAATAQVETGREHGKTVISGPFNAPLR